MSGKIFPWFGNKNIKRSKRVALHSAVTGVMKEMLQRKRVTITLSHKEPDRVPMDLTIKLGACSKLVRYLGLEYQVDLEPERRKNGQECTNR